MAQHALGRIALLQLNYAAAAEAFRAALPLADGNVAKIRALTTLSRATAFDPGDASIRYADEALAIAGVEPTVTKKTIASIQTLRARALFNHGRFAEAYATLLKAVSSQGGLDLKVNAEEIITRSDLALAALLAGKTDAARKYLAYTGAGRIAEAPFRRAVEMRPPPCGGPANLQPDDVAVVEFNISDDGSVGSATPIYASVNGPAAFEFARAVFDWSWQPETVAKIPALFRLLTRVELRCSNNVARPSVNQPLSADLSAWLKTLQVPPAPRLVGDAAALAPLKAELARRDTAGGGLSLLPVLLALSGNAVAPYEERQGWLIRARDLAINARAPVTAQIAIETSLAQTFGDRTGSAANSYRVALRRMLARPEVGADAVAADTLKLMISEPLYRSPAPKDAPALLRDVAGDTRLSAKHPLRVGALVRIATVQAAAGDMSGASASYAQTGLDTQQCALLDVQPALLRNHASSSDFPMEAMRWGFEGWVQTEYDILADGKTARQRAIIAYPPFVFRDSAVDVAKGAIYSTSYRPDGSAGCGGQQRSITFSIQR